MSDSISDQEKKSSIYDFTDPDNDETPTNLLHVCMKNVNKSVEYVHLRAMSYALLMCGVDSEENKKVRTEKIEENANGEKYLEISGDGFKKLKEKFGDYNKAIKHLNNIAAIYASMQPSDMEKAKVMHQDKELGLGYSGKKDDYYVYFDGKDKKENELAQSCLDRIKSNCEFDLECRKTKFIFNPREVDDFNTVDGKVGYGFFIPPEEASKLAASQKEGKFDKVDSATKTTEPVKQDVSKEKADDVNGNMKAFCDEFKKNNWDCLLIKKMLTNKNKVGVDLLRIKTKNLDLRAMSYALSMCGVDSEKNKKLRTKKENNDKIIEEYLEFEAKDIEKLLKDFGSVQKAVEHLKKIAAIYSSLDPSVMEKVQVTGEYRGDFLVDFSDKNAKGLAGAYLKGLKDKHKIDLKIKERSLIKKEGRIKLEDETSLYGFFITSDGISQLLQKEGQLDKQHKTEPEKKAGDTLSGNKDMATFIKAFEDDSSYTVELKKYLIDVKNNQKEDNLVISTKKLPEDDRERKDLAMIFALKKCGIDYQQLNIPTDKYNKYKPINLRIRIQNISKLTTKLGSVENSAIFLKNIAVVYAGLEKENLQKKFSEILGNLTEDKADKYFVEACYKLGQGKAQEQFIEICSKLKVEGTESGVDKKLQKGFNNFVETYHKLGQGEAQKQFVEICSKLEENRINDFVNKFTELNDKNQQEAVIAICASLSPESIAKVEITYMKDDVGWNYSGQKGDFYVSFSDDSGEAEKYLQNIKDKHGIDLNVRKGLLGKVENFNLNDKKGGYGFFITPGGIKQLQDFQKEDTIKISKRPSSKFSDQRDQNGKLIRSTRISLGDKSAQSPSDSNPPTQSQQQPTHQQIEQQNQEQSQAQLQVISAQETEDPQQPSNENGKDLYKDLIDAFDEADKIKTKGIRASNLTEKRKETFNQKIEKIKETYSVDTQKDGKLQSIIDTAHKQLSKHHGRFGFSKSSTRHKAVQKEINKLKDNISPEPDNKSPDNKSSGPNKNKK